MCTVTHVLYNAPLCHRLEAKQTLKDKMMFIRYLALLRALIMAHPSAATQTKKVGWCNVEKLTLPPVAVDSHRKNHPYDFPVAGGECNPPANEHGTA